MLFLLDSDDSHDFDPLISEISFVVFLDMTILVTKKELFFDGNQRERV